MGVFVAFLYLQQYLHGCNPAEQATRILIVCLIIAFTFIFFYMHAIGLQGYPRRTNDYAHIYNAGNALTTTGIHMLLTVITKIIQICFEETTRTTAYNIMTTQQQTTPASRVPCSNNGTNLIRFNTTAHHNTTQQPTFIQHLA